MTIFFIISYSVGLFIASCKLYTSGSPCLVRMLSSLIVHFFYTSMKFGTQLLCPMKTCFKTGPQPDLACGGGGSHFENG